MLKEGGEVVKEIEMGMGRLEELEMAEGERDN